MPKIRITSQSDVDNIPYSTDGKQIIWWSTGLDHFGVRAGARDKVYVVGVRVNRQWKLVTLGRAGRITVQKAIRDAKVVLGEMIGGIDPTARERARTASGLTLRQAWDLYQQTLTKLNRSAVTLRDYQTKIDCHLSDWLDRPLVSITREACNRLHTRIGEASGPYAANATMRVLRAIWRRTRRQHPELPEPPTVNIDFYPESAAGPPLSSIGKAGGRASNSSPIRCAATSISGWRFRAAGWVRAGAWKWSMSTSKPAWCCFR